MASPQVFLSKLAPQLTRNDVDTPFRDKKHLGNIHLAVAQSKQVKHIFLSLRERGN